MNRVHRIVLAALVLGACAPKGETASEGSTSDSTAAYAMDSTAAAAMMTMPGSTLRDSLTKVDSTAKAAKTPAKQTGIVGRDSAFGPTFIVDSTGKMVPIPTKKP